MDRVINGRHGVKERTKGRVLAVARRLGYISDLPSPPFPARDGRRRSISSFPPAQTPIWTARGGPCGRRSRGSPVAARVHRIEGFRPDILARGLAEIGRRGAGIGVVAIDHPLVRETIRELPGPASSS